MRKKKRTCKMGRSAPAPTGAGVLPTEGRCVLVEDGEAGCGGDTVVVDADAGEGGGSGGGGGSDESRVAVGSATKDEEVMVEVCLTHRQREGGRKERRYTSRQNKQSKKKRVNFTKFTKQSQPTQMLEEAVCVRVCVCACV